MQTTRIRRLFFALSFAVITASANAAPVNNVAAVGQAGATQLDQGMAAVQTLLRANQVYYRQAEQVFINVEFSNPGSTAIQLPASMMDPNGLDRSFLEVTRNGVPVPRLILVKLVRPSAAGSITLAPRQTLNVNYEISKAFDLSDGGSYQVSFVDPFHDRAANRMSSLNNISASFDVEINSSPNRASSLATPSPAGDAVTALAGSLAVTNCSASQQTTIHSAMEHAKTHAHTAHTYLTAGHTGSRYSTWFGTYVSSRYATLRAHFAAIADALHNKPITVDCGCQASYYAYVYPTQPYKIYVCNGFWTAPLRGADSKLGTLIHEISHFNAVASTDDWAYGQPGAKSLATSDPLRALDNADSHEYFAENTPSLP